MDWTGEKRKKKRNKKKNIHPGNQRAMNIPGLKFLNVSGNKTWQSPYREPVDLRQLLPYLRCTTMLRIYTYITKHKW